MLQLFTKPSEAVLAHRRILTQIIDLISSRATHVAKTTRKLQYAFPLSSKGNIPEFYVTFCKENLEELISTLYKAFPDTRISFKHLTKSLDGRLLAPSIDEDGEEYIVLDWS